MKVLVTGGCGFIGSNLVDKLIVEGHKVIVIDNLSSGNEGYYNSEATYIALDIVNSAALSVVFDSDIDWVFHLAAESRIQPTLENPALACRTNVVGTCNLLDLARRHNVKRFMYSSTSAGYGLQKKLPLKEDMPRQCLNPYSVTKLAGEDLCVMYHSLFYVPTISFRYFNVFGNRHPLKGQYAPVVGLFMEMRKDGQSLSIVGDGLQRRDFVNVQDVVAANILAATTEHTDIFGRVFNVGTGKNYSVIELAEMIGGPYHHIEARPGEARNTLADITAIQNNLGWEPAVDIKEWIDAHR